MQALTTDARYEWLAECVDGDGVLTAWTSYEAANAAAKDHEQATHGHRWTMHSRAVSPVVSEGAETDPPDPFSGAAVKERVPFLCVECGKEIARCEGGVSGQTCVYCWSSGGHCKCPHCGKEYYEISHMHV